MSPEHQSSRDVRSFSEILESVLGMLKSQVQDEWDNRDPDEQWLVPIFNVPEEHPTVLALEHGPSDYRVEPGEEWKHSFVRVLRQTCKAIARKLHDEEIGGLRIFEAAMKEAQDEVGFVKPDEIPGHIMRLLESGDYRRYRENAESMEVDFGRKPNSDKERATYRTQHPYNF